LVPDFITQVFPVQPLHWLNKNMFEGNFGTCK